MKVKANKAQFDQWELLCQQLLNQKSIFQNDMELTEEQIIEWANRNYDLVNSLQELENQVVERYT